MQASIQCSGTGTAFHRIFSGILVEMVAPLMGLAHLRIP